MHIAEWRVRHRGAELKLTCTSPLWAMPRLASGRFFLATAALLASLWAVALWWPAVGGLA